MIWSFGLRAAIVDTDVFSPLPYRAGQQAALQVQNALTKLVEVQRVAVGVNAFWSSSRGSNPEGSYAILPPGCLWLMLVQAVLDSGSAPCEIQAPVRAGTTPSAIQALVRAGTTPSAVQATVRAGTTPSAKAASVPSTRVRLRIWQKQCGTAYKPKRPTVFTAFKSRLMHAQSLKIRTRTIQTATKRPALKTFTANTNQTASTKPLSKTSAPSKIQTGTSNRIVTESPQLISETSSEESGAGVARPSRAANHIPWPTLPLHTFVRVPGSKDFTEAVLKLCKL